MTETKMNSAKAVSVRQLSLLVRPRKGGGHFYDRKGLKCRVVRPGVYRIWREDGERLRTLSIQIQLDEPWAQQKVAGFMSFCGVCHARGFIECQHTDECVLSWLPTKVAKWSAMVRWSSGGAKYFEVVISKTSPNHQSAKLAMSRPAAGAGFFVIHISRVDA